MDSKKRPADEDIELPPTKRHTVVVREPSIFGIKPIDDITKYIADFIAQHVTLENVEIEAKLGVFIDKRTNKRLQIGAHTETVLDDFRQYRFEANMPLEQHRHFNNILNETVNRTQARDYKGERVKYKHTIETDRFFESPTNHRNRYRVTTEQSTGKVVENGIIEKIRVADLNIHSPNQPLDFRISINLEQPREKPSTNLIFERNKDRISYQHGGIQFDLTQVKGSADRDPDVRHELELEFADSKALAAEKQKQDRKESSHYPSMIEVFVNNIRLLSRSALKK
ncbi:mRNA triphosphatase CET1 [Mucor mucedo]|uniref:mRNA triphosphatase CET1 n=1 Tax=Mucor mucedo TaxID=29922 RepID=UPI002220D545|nr:mRNA triphosphatase CET1 [Mucor mucedo]KAI7885965.1 mRNA triphosphatase CET1 [Mucor mucedo]